MHISAIAQLGQFKTEELQHFIIPCHLSEKAKKLSNVAIFEMLRYIILRICLL